MSAVGKGLPGFPGKGRGDILLALDLDNTLLRSRRRQREGDICVETLDGQEQSFLSPRAVLLLRQAAGRMAFVPVTTRSVAQYGRIRWPEGTEPSLAVTTNGAVLLADGVRDAAWHEASRRIVAPHAGELARQLALQQGKGRFLHCRIVDGSYLFLSCEDSERAERETAACRAETGLSVQCSGRKIYLLPPGLDKGQAVERLRRRLRPRRIFCAGDSAMDLPMLALADIACLPRDLPFREGQGVALRYGEEGFAESFLADLLAASGG